VAALSLPSRCSAMTRTWDMAGISGKVERVAAA
jgi:hypothetical protein